MAKAKKQAGDQAEEMDGMEIGAGEAEISPQPEQAEEASTDGVPAPMAELTAIKPLGIHERLESLELSLLGGSPEKGWAINRAAILTGTLKTTLPEVIGHIEEPALKADLEGLLGLL